jgi:hypothetical protein
MCALQRVLLLAVTHSTARVFSEWIHAQLNAPGPAIDLPEHSG